MKHLGFFSSLASCAFICALASPAGATDPNPLNIGALSDAAATPGAVLQFSDTGTDVMFSNSLGRSAAQWSWWRVDPANAGDFVPTMVVDSAFGLALFDPSNPSIQTIKLSPDANAVSELPKLKLSNQTLDDPTSVITQALGDNRYIRVAAANQSLTLATGINVNTGGSGSSNTVPANAAAIGQNLLVSSGQVVVGRNNASATDQIFVVGAGDSSTQTKNALSVSTSGNTTIAGSLAVTGAATLTSAAVSDTLTVGEQPVLTQDTADTRYLQNGQRIRVAPAGDIDMGEFQATPPGVTAPTAP